MFIFNWGLSEGVNALIYAAVAVVQMLWLSLKITRCMLLLLAGIGLVLGCYILNYHGIPVLISMASWLYVALNEDRLIGRFGLPAVTPISHGLFVVVLLAAMVNSTEYQLFGTGVGNEQQQIMFAIISLCCFTGFMASCYYISRNRINDNTDERTTKSLFADSRSMLLIGLFLLLSFSVPMFSIALTMMICGLYLQRQWWVMLGGLSLLYFIGKFYYDLDATLNTKSLFLLCFAIGVMAFRYLVKWQFGHLVVTKKELSDEQ